MYNQAVRAARRLRRLQVRYGDQASYLALLVEWMNGLCRTIHLNEDHIQQCWIQRYQTGNEELADDLEREIRRQSRSQEEDQNQLLRDQEQLQRSQTRIQREMWKALPTKPSTWDPSKARNFSHRENVVL